MIHAALALLFMAVLVVPLHLLGVVNAVWIGAAFSTAFYYGREVRDAENWKKSRLGVISTGKPYSLLPWLWHPKSREDFLWPAAASLTAALLVQFVA